MTDDRQYLEALDETVSAINEAVHDVNVALEHKFQTPEQAFLAFVGRVHAALKLSTSKLGPDWKM